VHVSESHVCDAIDPERCARCFVQSPFHAQMAASRLTGGRVGRLVPVISRVARRRAPWLLAAAGHVPGPRVTSDDVRLRLTAARNVLQTVDLFVAPSRALAEEYIRLGVPPARLVVSDYGFARVTPKPRQPSTTLRLGFVGTLAWHKGPHVLLEAVRRLPAGCHLRVFGDLQTFPAYTARLQQLAHGLPVSFEGSFDRDQLAEVYSRFDALVVASLWPENSPLVIHEAFQHGVAVVAARIGGIPDLVEDGVSGLLYDPFSVDSLAGALARLLHDRALLDRLVSAAPRVKEIAEDAREWDCRYADVLTGAGTLQGTEV
jgi:glycosyltransferase involved in cell wall biosynthesis